MVYTRSPDYLYRRNGIYYFTRNVPSDLKARFNKDRVVVSLHTRSEVRAQYSAKVTSTFQTQLKTLQNNGFMTQISCSCG